MTDTLEPVQRLERHGDKGVVILASLLSWETISTLLNRSIMYTNVTVDHIDSQFIYNWL